MGLSVSRSLFLAIAAAVLVAVGQGVARATTIVELSDADLAVSSRALVEGRVLGQESRFDTERGAVYTYVSLEVERVYKGSVQPGLVVLKQLGGEDGARATIIFGAPRFSVGDRVLLFLTTDDDGALRVAHLCLGDFRIVEDPASGQETVVRPHTDARILSKMGSAGEVTYRATKQAFLARIHQVLAERSAEAMSFEAERFPAPIQSVPAELHTSQKSSGGTTSNFNFLGKGYRWSEPDSGQPVRFRVNERRGPSPSGGVDEAKAAMEAWSTVPGSSLRIHFDGTTDGGGLKNDGGSFIAFGDPLNQIDDPVNCGGIIAQGGVTASYSGQTTTVRGRTFTRIAEGDVVVNNGWDCIFSAPATLAEVLTHELGHAIGLGHSSEKGNETDPLLRDATMFFAIHADGRGAAVREDDAKGIRFLYESSVRVGPLSITSRALPDAVVGSHYEYRFEASGTGPFTWSLASGSLPVGMKLSASGTLSGTASVPESVTFTVRVRDAANYEASQVFTLRAAEAPAPFLTKAKYNGSKGKLVVTGLYLSSNVRILVNGRVIAESATAKYRPEKSRLIVTGSDAELNIESGGANSLVIENGAMRSNEITF